MFTVDVSPDMGMYHLLRSQGYDQAYALAEFIDNALHAYLAHAKRRSARSPLDVSVYFYSNDFDDPKKRNSIEIVDAGPGITKARLADAMKPAKASPTKGLSEFGIGMKAAAVWFSETWTLSTKPEGGKQRYVLKFDLPALLKSGEDAVEVKELECQEPCGTTITLNQLRRPIDREKFERICADLRELYQRYTEGATARLKLTAYFNKTPTSLPYVAPDRKVLVKELYKKVGTTLYAIGQERKWNVLVDMTFQGVRIEGYVCILEQGSYKENPGLVMFRGDRVIRGTARRPNLPDSLFKTSNKYARQRVYGQLFADGLPVTYTKDGFEIDEDAFFAQLRAVDGMSDLLTQTETYRSKATPTKVTAESDIPGTKNGKDGDSGKGGSGGKDSKPTPQPKPPRPQPAPKPPAPLEALLTNLRPSAPSLAVAAIIEETLYQHHVRREIATAMCMRAVLELLVLNKLEKDFRSEYVKVADYGIKRVIGHMHGHLKDFFPDKRIDMHAQKCITSIAGGNQLDVVLLNNAAHGSYQPNVDELNRFATNLEPLLKWATS